MTSITEAQINRLSEFIGYGNLRGRFWFVGMEEHLDRDRDPEQDIATRATWSEVEDLHHACTRFVNSTDQYQSPCSNLANHVQDCSKSIG